MPGGVHLRNETRRERWRNRSHSVLGAGFPVCSLGSALESKGRGETHGLHELTRGPYSRAMATFVRFVALPITARFFPDRDEALPEALQQRRQRRQFIR
jgi:hypothetical protein